MRTIWLSDVILTVYLVWRTVAIAMTTLVLYRKPSLPELSASSGVRWLNSTKLSGELDLAEVETTLATLAGFAGGATDFLLLKLDIVSPRVVSQTGFCAREKEFWEGEYAIGP